MLYSGNKLSSRQAGLLNKYVRKYCEKNHNHEEKIASIILRRYADAGHAEKKRVLRDNLLRIMRKTLLLQ